MGHVFQDLGIDRLPVEQRMELVQEIWDSIALEMGLLPPTQEEQNELESRLAEDGLPPVDVAIWDEIKSETLAAMSRSLAFRRQARQEFDAAGDWYERERPGLGQSFFAWSGCCKRSSAIQKRFQKDLRVFARQSSRAFLTPAFSCSG